MSAGRDTKIFGGLGSISLHDLIQLLGMNGRTATLVLGREGRKGKIYFNDGNVIHAFTGEIEGPDAFAELLKWQDADFIIEDGIPTLPKVTISESAVGLMLSALARLDEESRDTPSAGSPVPHGLGEAHPARPPSAGRVAPRVRRPVTGAVITVPEKQRESVPIAPIAAALVLLAAGAVWWIVGSGASRPPAEVAAGAAPAPPPSTLAAPPEAGGEPTPEAASAEPAPAPGVPATPEPEAFGTLALELDPGVELNLDGRRVSAGTRRLSPGRHTAEVSRPDVIGVQVDSFEITAGQTLRRRYADDEFGWLQVVVIPWAEVLVGGQSIGQTPMGKVKAALGEHAVTLRHPGVAEQKQRVVVEKGETTLVRVTLSGVSG